MSARTGSVLSALVLGLLWSHVWAQNRDFTVDVSLNPTTIGLDQQAMLEVTIEGSGNDLPDIEMPSLPDLEVYQQGRSSQMSIVNGVMSASVTQRYLIVPKKAGQFAIRGITATLGNRKVIGNPVQLTVTNTGQAQRRQLPDEPSAPPAGSQNRDYFLVAEVDNRQPYVNQQVTLTLRFCIAVQFYSGPELDEPETIGFWTEVLGNSTPVLQKINGRTYRVIERKYALFPTQTGELTIGPATIRTTVASRRATRDPFGNLFDMFPQGEQVSTRSDPLTIKVKPLPDAGRPDPFSGSIGRYEISAAPDRTTVEVNQPVTLTVKITGVGNVKTVAEPIIPELADFRVYRAATSENITKYNDQLGGAKVFEEVFLPKRPGNLEIPALTLTFFDPKKGQYQTLKTRPIGITVTKPEGYVATQDVPYGGPSMTLGSESQDIRFIHAEPGTLRRTGSLVLFTPVYLIVNGLPVLALVGLVLVRKKRLHQAANVGLSRARGASRQARKRLAKARSLQQVANASAYYGELSLAVTAFVADRLNVSPHGLTSDTIREQLALRGVAGELIDQTVRFLSQCDFARFAPSTGSEAGLQEAMTQAEQLMGRLEEMARV